MESVKAVIDYLARHQAFHSFKSIAELAEVNGANLHASLAGRRPLPLDVLRRVAAVIGLTIDSTTGGKLHLEIQPETVVHLEIEASERPELAKVIEWLTPSLVDWKSISKGTTTTEEQGQTGADTSAVFFVAVAKLAKSYMVIHVRSSPVQAALKRDFDVCATETEWLRLRAGLVSLSALDAIFGKTVEPGIEDWAQMLLALSRSGITPQAVLSRTGH